MPKAKQPSRKSKSAWRKNIDLKSIDDLLERQRAAQRVGEEVVHQDTQSSSIFVEDREGDAKLATLQSIANRKPKKKGLKSLEILSNRSGAPGLQSRVKKSSSTPTIAGAVQSKQQKYAAGVGLTPEQRAVRAGIKKQDIERLRRATGRDVKGAFGIILEEDEPQKRGVEAVIMPSSYDAWQVSQLSDVKGKRKEQSRGEVDWLAESQQKDIQLPASYVHASKKAKSKTLAPPKAGQSYNPAAEDHEMLLNLAIEEARRKEEERQKELEWKKAWDAGAKEARGKGLDETEDLVGLKVGRGEEDDGKASEDEGDLSSSDDEKVGGKSSKTKDIKRKTKQQRARTKKHKEEERARLALKASKRSLSELQSLRSLKKQLVAMEAQKQEAAEKRRLAREKRNEERVGVYKLPKREEEVQLGEDLAEGLRTLKPEGNPLKDRLFSFHKHGIIEPRKRDIIGKTKRGSMRRRKEFESHAYKRFT